MIYSEYSQRKNMDIDYQSINHRYEIQAGWTENFQRRLLRGLHTPPPWKVLEIGCGTGAFLRNLQKISSSNFSFWGLDIDFHALIFADKQKKDQWICGDGNSLPLNSDSFDLILCHYYLLWIPDPVKVLNEMKRCCKLQGTIAVAAEPDYGGRIDFPESMQVNGVKQTEALSNAGIDPLAGRKLLHWMIQAGFTNPVIGIHGVERYFDQQCQFISEEKFQCHIDLNSQNFHLALQESNQNEIFFIPTFYSFAVKS